MLHSPDPKNEPSLSLAHFGFKPAFVVFTESLKQTTNIFEFDGRDATGELRGHEVSEG